MKRVVACYRISQEDEVIQNQEYALEKDIHDHLDWHLVRSFEFTEHGDVGQTWVNGSLVEERQELIQILDMAKQHSFDILWLYHHDRLTRAGGASLINYIRQFASMGVRIYDYQDKRFLDPDKVAMEEVEYSLHAFGARHYQEEVKRKTKNALDRIQGIIEKDGVYTSRSGRTITSLGRAAGSLKGGKVLDKNEVLRRHQAGESVFKIAKELGCSRTAVRHALAGLTNND